MNAEIVVLVAHPSADLYGSDRVLLESVSGLVNAGARVVVTTPTPGPLLDKVEVLGAEVELCRSPVLRKSMLSPLGLIRLAAASMPAAVSSIRLLSRVKPDVVYVNTLTIPLWTLMSRFLGYSVVVHVHEAERQAPLMVRRALAAQLLMSTCVVTNSNYSAGVLIRSYVKLAKRISVTYNGLPGPSANKEARHAMGDPIRLIYVGRISYRKGIEVAVRALAVLKGMGLGAHLDVVGGVYVGNEGFLQGLRSLSVNLGVADQITWHGFQDDVWPFLADADIAVVPSLMDEPFGDTAVEAMLAARPLVVSDSSGLREAAAGYASAQFVEPGNEKALAQAVWNVASDWPNWRALAIGDASIAAARHDPLIYQGRIAEQVLQRAKSRTVRWRQNGTSD